VITLDITVDPIPPITQVSLPFTYWTIFEGRTAYLHCLNTVPNPNAPKDRKTVKIDCGGGPGGVTGYPDGRVKATCRINASKFLTSKARKWTID
jgi:hypothetical protein